jgi:hypothetical protein
LWAAFPLGLRHFFVESCFTWGVGCISTSSISLTLCTLLLDMSQLLCAIFFCKKKMGEMTRMTHRNLDENNIFT